MLGVVELTADRVRHAHPGPATLPPGVRAERTAPTTFRLTRDLPGTSPVYYRVGRGRVEWSRELTDFTPGDTRPTWDVGRLLALLHGIPLPPDATPVPGVQQLCVGTEVRATPDGITVTRRTPRLPRARGSLSEAVAAALGALGDGYGLAYSGGLASAFAAVSAVAAGHRPQLLHADLGPAFHALPTPRVPGLPLRRVTTPPSLLLDHRPLTGAEPLPPLPDTEAPRRLTAHLAQATELPLAGGALLADLTARQLPDVDHGPWGWRLLACEPFHTSGTLRGLPEARRLVAHGAVRAPAPEGAPVPDEQPPGTAPPPRPVGATTLPGLTVAGQEAYHSARLAALAQWQSHLAHLPPVLGRAVAGLAERGDGGTPLPALAPEVLATVAALPPRQLARLRRGRFHTHLPLRRALRAHGVGPVRHSGHGHWLRLAAAGYLHRERKDLITRFEHGSPLADLGVLEPAGLTTLLQDGQRLADHALPVLRLVWLDQWLRGRA